MKILINYKKIYNNNDKVCIAYAAQFMFDEAVKMLSKVFPYVIIHKRIHTNMHEHIYIWYILSSSS